jgi:triacylglycerol lipase
VLATWITDLAALPKRPDVHGGFSAALEAVWEELRALLESEGRARRLFVTGHSLGGALAVLAARRARDEVRSTVDAVYAFGMPRAGDAAFGAAYGALNELTYRFVYGEDLVARVPPAEWSFRHVGHRFSCARGQAFGTSSPTAAPIDDDPAFAAHLAGNVASLFNLPPVGALLGTARTDPVGRMIELLPPPLRDHIPDRYWSAL